MGMEGGVMKMREVNDFLLLAPGVLELKPGAAHLMFVNISRPFKTGDVIPVTLRFERAGERRIELYVRPIDARGSK
jgi:copper(I)-binding protein